HEELGVNSRLDEVQAAILRVKLPHLDSWIARRRENAAWYRTSLGSSVIAPPETPGTLHVYHQYTVRVAERDKLQAALGERGIQTMVYYPVPLHLQGVHRAMGLVKGAFPNSEQAAGEVLSLPMFPELKTEQREAVAAALDSLTAAVAR
ncbi:MAG TPA: DegT/DnrJ/EryC1/StrS family aminotransferase, partial [Candidatus Baltobacteraceae bacterium]|nr:DegT/DnrJ/EryC1/StrS family aminotransferase [Candidatus Baltobacteraceae bacterium]